jgi:hypothetical protein
LPYPDNKIKQMICNLPESRFMDSNGARTIPNLEWSDLVKYYCFPFASIKIKGYVDRPSSFCEPETRVLIGILDNIQPKRVLEIGVSEGSLAAILLGRFASIRQYFGVDVPDTHSEHEATLASGASDFSPKPIGYYAFRDARFSLILSAGGTESLDADSIPRNIDVCIVDADHRYNGVKRDTELARSACRSPGIIVWHDYDQQHAGVKTYLDEIAAAGRKIISSGPLAWEFV